MTMQGAQLTPLEVAREAFASRLLFVLDLASKRDDRLTRKQADALVASLEVLLGVLVEEHFSAREADTDR